MSINNFIGKKVRPIELAFLLKKFLLIKRSIKKINGFNWFIDPISDFGLRLVEEGSYEKEMTALILDNLSENDTFVDLGGNEGYFSILASEKVRQGGKIYCIEPQQRLWNVILNNIQLNRCKNICLFPFAISDKEATIELTLSPDINTGSSTFAADARRSFWKKQTINAETLDSLFYQKVNSIELIKIDIEGFELFALKGAEKLLKNKIIKKLIIELHPPQLATLGQSIDDVEKYLLAFGYKENNGVYQF